MQGASCAPKPLAPLKQVKDAAMLAVGEWLNERYRIEQLLAEGGQSYVYLATDARAFDRKVIVKEYKPPAHPSADPQAAARQVEAMAQLLAQLNHPNIVQVIDFFFHNGTPILVTEFIEGETLEARMRFAPMGLPEEEVLRIAHQLCDALSYLHNHNPPIIYRDLTPKNVILTPTGAVKLIDFSIARTYKEDQAADTEAFGTAGYAPPEQHGKGQTGPYSDIYALGALLLYLATGFDPALSPFVLPRADKVHGDLKAISPALTNAIAKATQLDPKRRFQSVEAFRRALQGAPVEHRLRRAMGSGAGVAIGLIGLIALGLGGGLLAMSLSGSGLNLFARPATLTPTAALVAMQLPSPTFTAASTTLVPAAVPTRNPLPTATPRPAPTSTPQPTVTNATPTRLPPSPTPPTLPSPTPAPPTPTPALPTPTPVPPTPLPSPTPVPSPTPLPTATPVVVLQPTVGSQTAPVPRLDGISVPGRVRRGEPIEIAVWASNVGRSAAEFGGSITISFPEAERVTVIGADPETVIELLEPAGCEYGSRSYARVITPASLCKDAVIYSETCAPNGAAIVYPLVESWFSRWESGVQHYLRVRVIPRADAAQLTVQVRVAMISRQFFANRKCFAAIAPSEANADGRDQQNFPVRIYTVAIE